MTPAEKEKRRKIKEFEAELEEMQRDHARTFGYAAPLTKKQRTAVGILIAIGAVIALAGVLAVNFTEHYIEAVICIIAGIAAATAGVLLLFRK